MRLVRHAAADRARAGGGRAHGGREPAPGARDVTLPLVRYGMLASWLLIFLIFVREYSTGVYLLAPGTEVIGSLMVSLWGDRRRRHRLGALRDQHRS